MRNFILCTLLLFAATTALGQQLTPPDTLTRQDYLRKSKSQKTSGFIFLGLGATMIAIAAPGNVSFDVLPALVIGGGASILGSVPLFLAAGRNKRIAMSLSAQVQPPIHPLGSGTSSTSFSPAVSVRVRF